MMNIYEFLNSRDVRKYLEAQQYEFSTLAKAFVIFKSSHKSLLDKQLAWQELIESTEDIFLGEDGDWRWRYMKGASVHDLIAGYMVELDELQDEFYKDDPGAFYSIEAAYSPNLELGECDFTRTDAGIYFKDYAGVISYMEDWAKENEADCNYPGLVHRKITEFEINKNYPEDFTIGDKPMRKRICSCFAQCGEKFELTKIQREGFENEEDSLDIEAEFFGQMWFDIPIPFKAGDIVVGADTNWCNSKEPFVLLGTLPWNKANNPNAKHKEGCDSSDMNAWGWSGGWNGNYYEGLNKLNDDVMADYLDLEYYRGAFPGPTRIVKLMAEAEKKTIDYWEIINWTQLIYENTPIDQYLGSLNYDLKYRALAEKVLKEDPYVSW